MTALFRVENLLHEYAAGNRKFSVEYRRNWNHRNIWMSTTVNLLEHPETGHIIAFVTTKDIHFQKLLSEALNRTVEVGVDTASLVEIATNRSIFITSKKGEIYLPLKETHDYTQSIKQNIARYILPEDQEMCFQEFSLSHLCAQLETKEVHTIMYRMMPVDGRIPWKNTRVFYLDDKKAELIFVRTDITDVYEKEKKNQEKLKRAVQIADKANAAKSEFLSNMSHEIRTPLNAIIGMTKLMEEKSSTAEKKEYYIKQIDSSSQYLLGLINDILDMSRIESGKFELNPEWVTAGNVLTSCVEMLEPLMKEKNIHFIYPKHSVMEENREIYIDVLRVKQIMMNLLNNAYKFTESGGTVTLLIHDLGEDNSNYFREYIVQDTGCGMSEQFIRKVFEPFEQERGMNNNSIRGTGLGLTLVKKLLDMMGGTIEIESTVGIGTKITFRIKYQYRIKQVEKEQQEKEQQKKEQQEKKEHLDETTIKERLKGKRILVAEDNEINIAVVQNLLEAREMQPDIAINGKIALDKFTQSEPGTYDAVLMDIRMDVMDGMEATRRIRASHHPDAEKIPIIAMSANAFDEDVKMGKAAGMNQYLTKPINPQLLFETLAEYM